MTHRGEGAFGRERGGLDGEHHIFLGDGMVHVDGGQALVDHCEISIESLYILYHHIHTIIRIRYGLDFSFRKDGVQKGRIVVLLAQVHKEQSISMY